jgi:hypothetical protein
LPPSANTASSNCVPRWRLAKMRELPSMVWRNVTHAKLESSSTSSSGESASPPPGTVRSCGLADRPMPNALRAMTCVLPSGARSPHVMSATPSALTATRERSAPVPAVADGVRSAGAGSSDQAFVRRSRRATITLPVCVNVAYAVLLIDMSTDGSLPTPRGTGALQGWSPDALRIAKTVPPLT